MISADELISGERKKRKAVHSAYTEGEKVVFADLKIGDYVVHKTYGIGIYMVSIPLKQMERLKTISKSNTKMMIFYMYQQTKWI